MYPGAGASGPAAPLRLARCEAPRAAPAAAAAGGAPLGQTFREYSQVSAASQIGYKMKQASVRGGRARHGRPRV